MAFESWALLHEMAFYNFGTVLGITKEVPPWYRPTISQRFLIPENEWYFYCNAVLAGLPNSSISRLQRVQNNAARVLARVRKYDHITPILRQYHWLPVQKRIEYKILTLVFKALHNMAPKYLQDQRTVYVRPLRRCYMYVPKTRTAYGDRAFLCVAPSLWNKLPDHVRNMHCLETFQGHVKAHLFTQSY